MQRHCHLLSREQKKIQTTGRAGDASKEHRGVVGGGVARATLESRVETAMGSYDSEKYDPVGA